MNKLLLIFLLTLAPLSFASAPINYAPGIIPESFDKLHPRLKDIAHFIAGFCAQNNIKFVITSTIRSKERNAKVLAKSLTHVEARAFDFSIREVHGWTDELLFILVNKIERNYKEVGAITASGKQVVIFNHSTDVPGSWHSHIQIRRGLPWK